MSDNDNTEDTSTNVEEVEFASNPFGDDEDTTTTTPSEETTDAPAEPAEDNAEKTSESEAETPAEPEAPVEEPTPDEATEEKSDDVNLKDMTKAERKEYFQSLNQQQKQQVERAIDEVYQPQPLDQLKEGFLNEGYTDYEATMLARDTAREQATQIAEARAEIAELNSTLATEAYDVYNSIDWLNSSKEESYDEKSADIASKLYEALAIVKDPRTRQIVEAKISPKQFYQALDQIRNSGSSKAQLKAQKAAEAQMAAAAPPTSTAPPAANASAEDKQASSLERALNNVR